VTLSPLPSLVGFRIKKHMGCLQLPHLREISAAALKNEENLSNLYSIFFQESHAIARAHTAAYGANALLNFKVVVHESRTTSGRQTSIQLLLVISGDMTLVE
jgi:hypothetical protein